VRWMPKKRSNFIQWKGTDICMDFYCPECGTHSHVDGFFCFHVKCPYCQSIYTLADEIQLTKADQEPEFGVTERQ